MECNSGIYEIKNLINNSRYIGSAVNLCNRRSVHFSTLRSNSHDNSHLQRAFNKYGEDGFIYIILFYCNKNDLILFEQRTIDVLRPEYNIRKIAGSNLGFRCTEKMKQAISNANRGNKYCFGRIYTEETKEKMRKTLGNKTSGENGPGAKLTWNDVYEIRRLFSTGKISKTLLSKMFKITSSNINCIIRNRTWKII